MKILSLTTKFLILIKMVAKFYELEQYMLLVCFLNKHSVL